MKKNDILTKINLARIAHIAWVNKAKLLVYNSNKITKDEIPLEANSCSFGQWFFGVGQVLFCIMSEDLIKQIEHKHQELHNSYLKIFQLYFNETTEKTLLLETQKKIDKESQKIAEEELRNLENISEELIALLERIETNFNQIEDEDLSEICSEEKSSLK